MIGCLCIHGFTGSLYEVEPLAEYLRKNTNWEIIVPTLPGHEEEGSLKGISYTEWMECAEEALQELIGYCEKVYVIGFSMGGMIACHLASKYPVEKLVLLSAAAKYVHLRQLTLDIVDLVKEAVKGQHQQNELFLRYKNKIKKTPLSATIQFRTLVARVIPLMETISIPTLIAQGGLDGIVPPKSADYIYQHLSSRDKKIIHVENAKHLICHCEEKLNLFQEIHSFLGDQLT
ncbi:alpha/beta hydrolase [Peribacillus alkalitolerans]|uniref:alpha/beta hydrolase n=1 Tax=Peribacillus alkalitolerans TaxID=1550385 RepID=UPI0013D0D6EA|nr:alpha/beta fold hydrolase [Peribacillus alkalitolerans]